MLLSSLEGYAIVFVRIDGVLHEFSTIPGVYEDVTEILLNLKQVRFKYLGSEPIDKEVIKIELSDQEVFKAGDIERFTASFEIPNKDLVICHMEPSVKLNMELTVYRGVGYLPQEEFQDMDLEKGVIPVDAIFSPIKKVRVGVSNVRVGKYTNYEQLELEVTTDGTIRPDDAIKKASAILLEHFQLVQQGEARPSAAAQATQTQAETRDAASLSFEELGLPKRIINVLKEKGIESVADLVAKSEAELKKIRGLGPKTIVQIKERLKEFGLSLAEEAAETK